MNNFQIEAWAISVVENVINGKPNEDSRVELKAKWPEDERKTARNIAAHANLARGESILWIIGVDEKSRIVCGVDHKELSSWYEKITANFDNRVAPTYRPINIIYDGKTIVALYFETESFPYVVKYSNEILEVPWREGTSTRSAKRLEILKLLTPLQLSPTVDILNGKVTLDAHATTEFYWNYHLEFYFVPNGYSPLVIPFHKCRASLELEALDFTLELPSIRLQPPYQPSGWGFSSRIDYRGPENLSRTIEDGPDELLVHGPGRVIFTGTVKVSEDPPRIDAPQSLRIFLSLLPINALTPTNLLIDLVSVTDLDPQLDHAALYKWLVRA